MPIRVAGVSFEIQTEYLSNKRQQFCCVSQKTSMAKEQNRNALFPLSAEGHWSRTAKIVTDMNSKFSKYTSFLSVAELVTVRKYYLT
jgi:FPC/CPF motif-containing protein YcgG